MYAHEKYTNFLPYKAGYFHRVGQSQKSSEFLNLMIPTRTLQIQDIFKIFHEKKFLSFYCKFTNKKDNNTKVTDSLLGYNKQ